MGTLEIPFAQHHSQKIFGIHVDNNFPKDFAINVLKRALYGLNTAYNPFHNFFGEFLMDISFNPSR